MWYIFNEDNRCVASSDFEPNHNDLATRNEIAINNDNKFDITKIKLENNVIVKITETAKEVKQEQLNWINRKYTRKLDQLENAKYKAVMLGNSTKLADKKYKDVMTEYKAKLQELIK